MIVGNENFYILARPYSRKSDIELPVREARSSQGEPDTTESLALTLIDRHCESYSHGELSSSNSISSKASWYATDGSCPA